MVVWILESISSLLFSSSEEDGQGYVQEVDHLQNGHGILPRPRVLEKFCGHN